jgi:hypothetical protein
MAGSAPSTATVLEFRCLFTHDLRRRQKRWQDGRLKYHTFNARVMVYDERGNSVGDMHWHGEYDFGEGEEVQLDRGGVIVQVEDLVERRETDLSELVDKRVHEKQQRQMQQLTRSAGPSAILPRSLPRPPAVAPDRAQPPQHRPLHRVIGTPTGHHGKALVPKESPFEQRQRPAESANERIAKRRKYDDPPPSKSGYASALFGQTLTLSATPSSSVPAIRRPRPEAGSDSPAETDAQCQRSDPKPARHEQPQSPRHFNQRGYAHLLFGQTLTLSHTPVSSVPSRPKPCNKPALNAMVDDSTQIAPEIARSAAPQQLNELRHLDQSGSNSRSTRIDNQRKISNRPAKGSADVNESNRHASLYRQQHITNTDQAVPESINIIEIDDPQPSEALPVRQPRTRKTMPEGLWNLEQDLDNSNVAAGRADLSQEGSLRPRTQQRSQPGRQDKSTKARSHGRRSKIETAVPQADNIHASPTCTDTSTHEHTTCASVTTRDPTLPVTELRIKSSRKRGLLIISDSSQTKMTRRQVQAASAGSLHCGSTHRPRESDNDDPFHQSSSSRLPSKFEVRHGVGESTKGRNISPNGNDEGDCPSLKRNREWEEGQVVSNPGKNTASRLISTELGDVDDPFQSQAPDPTYEESKHATRNDDKQLVFEATGQVKAIATAENAADAGLCFVENDKQEAAEVSQPTKRSSPLPRAGYDTYRIPSSPPCSSPGIPFSAQRKGLEHDVGAETLGPIDSNRKLGKVKKQKRSLRNVIADDDDKDNVDLPIQPPRNTNPGSDSEPGTVSVLCEESVNTYLKPRKSMNTGVQRIPTVESGDERSRRPTRQNKSQQREVGVQAEEDELPIARRQSRRRRRSRATSCEDPEPEPLVSEQHGSGEEDIPRKRRKTKTSKASEDRPRLEKIKKNVKSRELVGFNLAALNAPLGLRGIGMPFSILPTPVNESIQRHVPSHPVGDENLMVDDEVEDQMPSRNPKPCMAALKTNARAEQSLSKGSDGEVTNQSPLQTSDYRENPRNSPVENDFSELMELGGGWSPESPDKPKIRGPSEPGGPGANLPSPTRTKSKQIGSQAPSSKQKCPAPIPTQSTTIAKWAASEKTTLEDPVKEVGNAQSPSAPAQTTATEPAISTGLLPPNKSNANGRQPSNTAQETVQDASPKEPVAADRPRGLVTKSQTATWLNLQKQGMQRQLSILDSAEVSNRGVSGPNIQAEMSVAPSAVDRAEPAPNRHSLTICDQDTATVEVNMGEVEPDKASDLHVRPPNAIGLRHQVPVPLRINKIGTKSTPQAESTDISSTDVHSKPTSNVRLANPASRGRKAALASHAAGPVPQRILPPTQPPMIMPSSTADLAMTQFEQSPKQPERQKKKMMFPGFQSARSDGPWSREAFDLLESGRPE